MRNPVILWVEDNAGDVVLLQEAFREERLAVEFVVVARADEIPQYVNAEGAFKAAPRPPDLVLTDLNVPGSRGPEVIAELIRHTLLARLPLLVFTSSTNPHELRRCTELGAIETISKPQHLRGFEDVAQRIQRRLPKQARRATASE